MYEMVYYRNGPFCRGMRETYNLNQFNYAGIVWNPAGYTNRFRGNERIESIILSHLLQSTLLLHFKEALVCGGACSPLEKVIQYLFYSEYFPNPSVEHRPYTIAPYTQRSLSIGFLTNSRLLKPG